MQLRQPTAGIAYDLPHCILSFIATYKTVYAYMTMIMICYDIKVDSKLVCN